MAHPLDQLEDIDELLDALTKKLQPLIKTPVHDHANKLPVADKARLYVLTTYALQSLLFSYLRLQGVSTKDHPVMREITRVKQYMDKIKSATPAPAPMKLDQAAAGRFIKAALAGNDEYDAERAAREEASKTAALEKLKALDKKTASGDVTKQETKKDKKGRKAKDKMGERRKERKEGRKEVRAKNRA
ncbi:Similar to Nuclear nucleic acid-binding protein C1D; acc. no. Q5XJ97 [Pyronema omphalodes CBS 100304]|uniref:Exosome complex protein n=1 Tax=Pyronema omphalodes (strain CBS 100304) TaxID=1076935 RepID=U4LY55_PYROM|nr:Similar to Nuclear nucleic acid-binding protein C1D; acc. no. Q5XJ97 [Pyronema omphalodes CBS 100304]